MKKCIALVALSLLLAGCGEVVAPVATPTPTPTLANGVCNPSCSTDTSPVPTQAPIPTPTADVSDVKQNIANAIQADNDTVTYCLIVNAATTPVVTSAGQAITITSNTSSEPGFINGDRAKECIFDLEQDAWTADPSASQVTVHVEILLQDQYGKQSTGDVAWAVLKQATERQFAWANLSYTQAWADYDQTWVLPGA